MASLHVAVQDQALSIPSRPLHRGSGCHECRRRKLASHNHKLPEFILILLSEFEQKCSGSKPACDRCVKSGAQCLYDPVEKSKVALLRDEVVMLRERVKVLEAAKSPTSATTPSDSRPVSREGSNYYPSHVFVPPVQEGALVRPPSWRVALSVEDQSELSVFSRFYL